MDKKAERIRELRTLAGLTQFDVAKKARIERSRVSLIENGHVRLTEDEYAAIESVLRPVARRRVRRIMIDPSEIRMLTEEGWK